MEPKRVDALTGLGNFLQALVSGNPYPDPNQKITTDLEGITVDTCLPPDTGTWETAIKRINLEGKWIVVEQYDNEDSARKGHEKWVKEMTEFPDFPLEDIDLWSLR